MDQSGGYFVSQFDPNTNGPANAGQSGGQSGDRKNLVAVSLSQVVHCTRKDDGLVIHRQKVHSLTTIGLVVSIEELTTKNIYRIDDQTRGAPVEVQYWKNDDNESMNSRYISPPPISEKTYVRVIGQSRYDDKKPFIVAFRVEPITDPNEIYMHFLEVITDSIVLQRRKNETLSASMNNSMDTNSFSMNNSTINAAHMQGFTPIQKTVLNLISKADPMSAGITRQEIMSSIPAVGPNEITKAIDFLANEGHIFSTTDEDTFKATDS
ncbi:replication protein A 32 kDa subunit-like [Oppia nitens]|uniref:replication protein A 32 kDa subunit-like n=1 Tax=Oppia nitens TaxID=1686743 RepID=UPI0023DA4049|nr:replication protein A 32 kDa subunit-like [Oppia nitens]